MRDMRMGMMPQGAARMRTMPTRTTPMRTTPMRTTPTRTVRTALLAALLLAGCKAKSDRAATSEGALAGSAGGGGRFDEAERRAGVKLNLPTAAPSTPAAVGAASLETVVAQPGSLRPPSPTGSPRGGSWRSPTRAAARRAAR
jgi:hypothetical protein